jgi:hypothetical protein
VSSGALILSGCGASQHIVLLWLARLRTPGIALGDEGTCGRNLTVFLFHTADRIESPPY